MQESTMFTTQASQEEKNGKGKKPKRNIWSAEEVRYFLSLVKEKQVVGLMDGKRLRVTDIFKSLVGPMKDQGFVRDSGQLVVKYKNLKAEFYKCKRHNAISGNSPLLFEFYDEMNDILGSRPITQSCDSQTGFEILLDDIPVADENDTTILPDVEIVYEDAPDFDGEVPGPSSVNQPRHKPKTPTHTPCHSDRNCTRNGTPKRKMQRTSNSFTAIENYLQNMENNQRSESEADRDFFNKLLEKQENIMINCTRVFLSGLKEILDKKENQNSSTENDGES